MALTIEIHPEEDLQPFQDIGFNCRILELQFENCVRTLTNMVGYRTQREELFDWEVFGESKLLDELRQMAAIPGPADFLHHRFGCAGGSTIEVVAERVFIDEGHGQSPVS